MIREEKIKKVRQARRVARTRRKLLAHASTARLSVFASNSYFYAQIIDDTQGKTILAAGEKELKLDKKMTKTERAEKVGELLAEKAKKGKIETVVFDRGAYRYHGRVKAFAEAARKGGLTF